MEINYHAQFLLDKEKDNSTAKIRFRIKWDKNIVAFNLGYRAEIDKWSIETQRCKTNTTHGEKKVAASSINKKIKQYETACENVFRKFDLDAIIPDDKNFRDFFNLEIGKKVKIIPEIEQTFFEIFDLFTKEESKINQWTTTTSQKLQTLKNHLLRFDANIKFEDLTEKKLFDYQFYLQKKQNFKNSTVIKHFSFLRWFLRWAKKKGYNKPDTFE